MRTAFLERLINRSWTRLPRCKTCERRAFSDGRVASMAYATEHRTQCTVPGIGAQAPARGRRSLSGWRPPHISGARRSEPWGLVQASLLGQRGGVHAFSALRAPDPLPTRYEVLDTVPRQPPRCENWPYLTPRSATRKENVALTSPDTPLALCEAAQPDGPAAIWRCVALKSCRVP